MSTIFHIFLPEKRVFIRRNHPGRHLWRSQPRRSAIALVLILLITALLSFSGLGCGGSVGTEAVAPISSGSGSGTGVATLAWNAPTTNADGSTLTDLAGYKIYFGVTPGVYTKSIDVGSNTTHQVSNLTVGTTYYFTVTAYNTAGIESNYATPPVSKTIN